MGNNNKMTVIYVQKIWVKIVVILGWFPFLAGFRVYGLALLFWAFVNRIDGKQQNEMTENDMPMVFVQQQVIMCWFVIFSSFRGKWLKLLTIIFLSRIDGKQQNDRKLCAKDLGEKWSYLGLVFIFGSFSCLGSFTLVMSIF